MIAWFARMAAVFVCEFRREYKRQLEMRQPPVIERPRLFSDSHDPAMAIVDEYVLRDALHRALRRYSPTEPPAEA